MNRYSSNMRHASAAVCHVHNASVTESESLGYGCKLHTTPRELAAAATVDLCVISGRSQVIRTRPGSSWGTTSFPSCAYGLCCEHNQKANRAPSIRILLHEAASWLWKITVDCSIRFYHERVVVVGSRSPNPAPPKKMTAKMLLHQSHRQFFHVKKWHQTIFCWKISDLIL